jgi:hypothetical protein
MGGMHRYLISIAVALAATTVLAKSPPPPPPPPEAVPQLAAQLADHLRDRTVLAPDGASVAVMAATEEEGPEGLLDATRLEACLRTVGDAEAWPSAWLVVQVEAVSFDLVLPVRLDDGGQVEAPETVFAAPRRQWTVDALRDAIRSETGRKPKGRTWNLVVQRFTTRVVNRYIYQAPTERRGLLELLPEGTLLREARTVKLATGERYTLALVLQEAELVPSRCGDCDSWMVGHADTGRILLVLASDAEIVDRLDLTPLLAGESGRPLLPRYPCEEGDREPEFEHTPIAERFAGRREVELIRLEDLDADGLALEISILSGVSDCEAEQVAVVVGPSAPKLRVMTPGTFPEPPFQGQLF